MNIFDLIFEAKKEDPYTNFNDFKTEASKPKVFDYTQKTVSEKSDEEKAKANEEKTWGAESSISQSKAIDELKKNISKRGSIFRGNAILVDKKFPGKSLQDFVEDKKTKEGNKSATLTQSEVQKAINASDKAFMDAVSILHDLNVLRSSSISNYSADNINYLLGMLKDGSSINNAIINLKTWQSADTEFLKLKKEFKDLDRERDEIIYKQIYLESNKNAEIEKAKAREQERSKEEGYDKDKGAFELETEINHIHNSFLKEKENLAKARKRLDSLIEINLKKLDQKREDARVISYSPGAQFQKIKILTAKADTEQDPKKKQEFLNQVKKMKEDWFQNIDKMIDERKELDDKILNLESQIRSLKDELEQAKTDGKTKEVIDLTNNIKEKEEERSKLITKSNTNVFAKEKGVAMKSFRTIKSFNFKNPSDFVNDLRSSIFTMGKNLLYTLTRAINLIYSGFDESGIEGKFGRLPTENERKLIQQKKEIDYQAEMIRTKAAVDADVKKWGGSNYKRLQDYKNKLVELVTEMKIPIEDLINNLDIAAKEKKELLKKLTLDKNKPDVKDAINKIIEGNMSAKYAVGSENEELKKSRETKKAIQRHLNKLSKKKHPGYQIFDVMDDKETDEEKALHKISNDITKKENEIFALNKGIFNSIRKHLEKKQRLENKEEIKNIKNMISELKDFLENYSKKFPVNQEEVEEILGDGEEIKKLINDLYGKVGKKVKLDNAISKTTRELRTARDYKAPSWYDVKRRIEQRVEEE